MNDLLVVSPEGLRCAEGGFHVDPSGPVERAVITHAHADHARPGAHEYWCSASSLEVLRVRLGADAVIHPIEYEAPFALGETTVSLHPAGHVLGSAQVRVEHPRSGVWVVSGDYKRDPDPTCAGFTPVACDTFVTEATFALPVYQWPSPESVARELFEWWQAERAHPTMVFCYAFGKAQRILAHLAELTDRPVFLHGAMERLTDAYRRSGVRLIETRAVPEKSARGAFAGELILCPPSAHRSPWMKRFTAPQTAFASGWMAIRGQKRRRGYERGFVLSDHADWGSLLRTCDESRAHRILVTHGTSDALARYLRESRGLDAHPLGHLYEGDEGES
jgi:putative mRNA 3-end processing factor